MILDIVVVFNLFMHPFFLICMEKSIDFIRLKMYIYKCDWLFRYWIYWLKQRIIFFCNFNCFLLNFYIQNLSLSFLYTVKTTPQLSITLLFLVWSQSSTLLWFIDFVCLFFFTLFLFDKFWGSITAFLLYITE